jgi:beta-glucosidase
MPEPVIPERNLDRKEIAAGTSADAAVITIGRTSGEFADRDKERGYYLTDSEKDLIRHVSKAFHTAGKKVIVVINSGGVVETISWRDDVDAILLAWLPGQEAGDAIADVLSGKINPSGKLPSTFSRRYNDDPTSEGFPGKVTGEAVNYIFLKSFPSEIVYDEGIYVGYRAFDKHRIKPAYEFGYGLSYTSFEYSNLVLNSKNFNDEITITVDVKNTGAVAGKEIAQLYLSAPAMLLDKPENELKGFAKTRLLKPDETQTLEIKLDKRSLASFYEKTSSWIAEKGVYKIRIGASSRDIKLKAGFRLLKPIIVEKVKNVEN